MRYSIIFIMSVLCCHMSFSQIYEVGLFAGGSNLIGDVGSTKYISPNQPAIGGILNGIEALDIHGEYQRYILLLKPMIQNLMTRGVLKETLIIPIIVF